MPKFVLFVSAEIACAAKCKKGEADRAKCQAKGTVSSTMTVERTSRERLVSDSFRDPRMRKNPRKNKSCQPNGLKYQGRSLQGSPGKCAMPIWGREDAQPSGSGGPARHHRPVRPGAGGARLPGDGGKARHAKLVHKKAAPMALIAEAGRTAPHLSASIPRRAAATAFHGAIRAKWPQAAPSAPDR